ncbi:MAG: potassium transporter TrkG [Clostridia bacterium]
MKSIRWRPNALQTLALGFALIIVCGALILMLPVSNKGGGTISFLDALFTATSATCVTGLIVFDTYTQFTGFGQLVIILLIQTGGLGFMTVAVMFAMVLKKRIGLKERSFLMEAVSSLQLGGVVRFARHILIGTAAIELTGALLLSIRFVPQFGWAQGIWFSVFHAISAFCNAGFDLIGVIEPYTSLTPYAADALVNLVIMGLIVVGGIGFIVWEDVSSKKFKLREYKLHTKIVLISTVILTLGSAIAFLLLEKDGVFAGMGPGERVLAALFQAVTPRTAGFNTVDTGKLTEASAFLTTLNMLVGASPGSTAGGVKITTVAVLVLAAVNYARRREDVNLFGRRLEDGVVKRACCASTMYLACALTGSFILMVQQGVSLTDASFEAFSALGTVGMTRGITRSLTPVSKSAVALLMYIGRVGSLSVAMAFVERSRAKSLRNPAEKIVIG